MSDWKQQLREAKEMLEEGLIDQAEFDAMKQQIRASVGLSKSIQSNASPSQNDSATLNSFVPALKKYSSTMKGTWDEQHPSRLKGFLLDTLGSDVESSTVGMFVQLSFQEKLVSLVQSNDNLGLQKHCQQLGKRYNSALVAESCQVWHQVFGRKGKVLPSLSPKQQKSVLSRPKKSAPSVTPSARPKPPKASDVQYFGRGSGGHEMVCIPAGEFMMGALPNDGKAFDREKPRHRVTISQPFLLGKYAVTQDLYESVMGKNPSYFKGATCPVEEVSWCDAVLFCNKLSEREGLQPVYNLPTPFANDNDWSKRVTMNRKANGYRLPTEAEWEYAARGGAEHLYAGSNNIDDVAWYDSNSGDRTHPVGQKKSNGFGLYDMSGNVYEWVWDWYGNYSSSSQIDPTGSSSGSSRVLRGGSWYSFARNSRVSRRSNYAPSRRLNYLGFRLSRSASAQ